MKSFKQYHQIVSESKVIAIPKETIEQVGQLVPIIISKLSNLRNDAEPWHENFIDFSYRDNYAGDIEIDFNYRDNYAGDVVSPRMYKIPVFVDIPSATDKYVGKMIPKTALPKQDNSLGFNDPFNVNIRKIREKTPHSLILLLKKPQNMIPKFIKSTLLHEITHILDPKFKLGLITRQETISGTPEYYQSTSEFDAKSRNLITYIEDILSKNMNLKADLTNILKIVDPSEFLAKLTDFVGVNWDKFIKYAATNPKFIRKLKQRIYNYFYQS